MPVRFYGGPLASASEGFAAGSEGFARGMMFKQQQKRQAERDAESDRRYEEEKARAVEAANRQVANDVFTKNIQGRQQDRLEEVQARANQQQDQQAEGSQALAQFGVTGNRMGPPDPEEEFAMDVARRMTTPAMAERFVNEYGKQKREKMLTTTRERHLSEIETLMNEPGAAEFMSEPVQARLKGAFDDLSAIEDPSQLEQILPLTKQTIDKTRDLFAEQHARKQEVEAVGGYYQQRLAEDMQNAMLERNPAIKAWKLSQIDQQRRYLGAFMTSRPGTVKASDFMTRMSQMDNDFPASLLNQGGAGAQPGGGKGHEPKTYDDFLLQARKVLGNSTKITEEQVDALATKMWKRQQSAAMDSQPEPNLTPGQGGEMPFSEGPGQGAFDMNTPEGKKAALKALLEQFGIDPNAPAPEKKRGGGRLLKSTGDSKLDDFYASSPK